MIIVCNTSPLIFLIKINRLGLLFKLYDKIHIAESVFMELSKRREDVDYIKQYISHIIVEKVKHKNLILNLGEGESDAINLAINKKARLILLDEHKARLIAKNNGLNTIGTLGLLLYFLENKFMGFNGFKESLNLLIKANFRVSVEIYNEVLKEAEKIYKQKT